MEAEEFFEQVLTFAGEGVAIVACRHDVGVAQRAQIAATAADAAAGAWTAREALILRLADELHDTSSIGDALWGELKTRFRTSRSWN